VTVVGIIAAIVGPVIPVLAAWAVARDWWPAAGGDLVEEAACPQSIGDQVRGQLNDSPGGSL
jgi:hypothetical protein